MSRNITSGIALVAAPFYATYAGVKGGLAKFGESLRRELKGEGVHVMTVYPGATEYLQDLATGRIGASL